MSYESEEALVMALPTIPLSKVPKKALWEETPYMCGCYHVWHLIAFKGRCYRVAIREE